MSAFTEAVERNLKGVRFFSVGALLGCEECGLAPRTCPKCDGTCTVFVRNEDPLRLMGDEIEIACHACGARGEIAPTGHDRECAEEGYFASSSCDSCGSTLGGLRYPAHGVIAETVEEAQKDGSSITHFNVCADCLMYHANCEEPEVWG